MTTLHTIPDDQGPDDYSDTGPAEPHCPSCAGPMAATGPAVCPVCAERGICAACAKPHYTWQCPQIALRVRGPACATCNDAGLIASNGCGDACGGWAERCPDCARPAEPVWDGQKIAKAFHGNYSRFIATLRALDVITRAQWAVAYAAHMAHYNTTRTPLTAGHVMRIWNKALEREISFPPRAA